MGAPETIARNERLGWTLWSASVLASGALSLLPRLRARGWKTKWPLLALLFVHPGWWMSARSGDCGYTLRDGSIIMTTLLLAVGGIMYWRAGRTAAGSSAQ